MTRSVVFSGTGRYTDPWHPFAETSAALADVVAGMGWEVEVRTSEPAALGSLDGVDLLVVNSGCGDPAVVPERDAEWDEAFASVARFAARGGAIYGVHTASNTFRDWPEWAGLLGGRWVRGTSGHPRRSVTVFEAAAEAESLGVHAGLETLPGVPDTGGRPCVVCYDERYSDLEVFDGSTPLLQHETDEQVHACAWLSGSNPRVAYDGLGHNARSYTSASRRRFMENVLRHLVEGRPGS